jgi:hypothetical protein
MLSRVVRRTGGVGGTQPLPFLFLGGRRRLQPPLLAVCQIDGQSYGDGSTGIVGIRLIKQNTLACEHMRELYRCENALEAELLAAAFGLGVARKADEEAVGLETVSLALMKALLFAEQPLANGTHRVLKAKVLEMANEMEWVGVRWIPSAGNEARKVPGELGRGRGDGEGMR